jgi:hypothetical protein
VEADRHGHVVAVEGTAPDRPYPGRGLRRRVEPVGQGLVGEHGFDVGDKLAGRSLAGQGGATGQPELEQVGLADHRGRPRR